MTMYRVRKILTRQRTQISNALRTHVAEFGIISAIGRRGLERLITVIADWDDARLPDEARACLAVLCTQLEMVKEQLLDNDRRIFADARKIEAGRRLMKIPGIGPLLASAIVACVPEPKPSPTAEVSRLRSESPRDVTPSFPPAGIRVRP